MTRRRTTITIEDNLIRLARAHGAINGKSLGDIIEESIVAYMPANLSGPTVSLLQFEKSIDRRKKQSKNNNETRNSK